MKKNLEVNSKRKTKKFTNIWKLNRTLLNNWCVKGKIKREIRKKFKANKNEHTYQNQWDEAKAVLQVHNNKHLHLKRRKISNKNLTWHIQEVEKEEENKPKANKRKKMIDIRVS